MPAVLRTVTATRYVTPLREGGSLPAHRGGRRRRPVRAQVPRRGAGAEGAGGGDRGRRAGPRARAAGAGAGARSSSTRRSARAEPDPEIQDLIDAERRHQPRRRLPARRAARIDPTEPPDAELAADVVWLDALVTNVDRTPRNPNLLRWHGNLWLIDHGAALYVLPRRATRWRARAAAVPGDPRPRAAARAPGSIADGRRAAGRRRPTRRRRPRWSRPSGPTARRTPRSSTRGSRRRASGSQEAERARP